MSYAEIPPYFSWVIDKLLAVSALPYHHTHLKYYKDNGIHTIVSITDSVQPPFHTRSDLKIVHLNIHQDSAPSLADLHNFVSLVENAKRRGEVLKLIFK
jgi:atypical dual specificity phosphatase